jgi:4'-phosphopantetheinyl transferase
MLTLTLVRARLDAPPLQGTAWKSWLSTDERERVAGFRFERHARRQEVATGLLRGVMGAVTGQDPAALVFDRGAHGKPYLADGPAFNVSHSGEWWLCGWADEGRVGVDVEIARGLSDLEGVARHSFHPTEVARVLDRSGDARIAAFFRVWSRKEAFIKAVGLGLAYPLDGFVVSAEAEPERGLLAVDDPAEPPEAWLLQPVQWSEGLGAAAAWDRPGGRIRWESLDRLA